MQVQKNPKESLGYPPGSDVRAAQKTDTSASKETAPVTDAVNAQQQADLKAEEQAATVQSNAENNGSAVTGIGQNLDIKG